MTKNRNLFLYIVAGTVIPVAILAILVTAVFFLSSSTRESIHSAKQDIISSTEFALLAGELKWHIVQVQQSITDHALTRGAGGQDAGLRKAEEHARAFNAGLDRFTRHYQEMGNAAMTTRTTEAKQAFARYYESGTKMSDAYTKEGTEAGNRLMTAFDKGAASLAEAIDPIMKDHGLRGTDALSRTEVNLGRLHGFIGISGTLAVLAALLTVFFSMGFMVRKAHLSITELAKSSRLLTSIAEVTADAASEIADGAHSQASAIEESSSQLEEMTDRSTKTSTQSQEIAMTAGEVKNGAERGKIAMEKLDSAISRIKTSSDDMARIVRTIDEIAFQTNLLSLNAAVEAARAGEAGAGFAVVADEVRNLAQRSASAAAHTTELIEEAQKNAAHGVQVAQEVGSLLSDIIYGVEGVTVRIDEISKAIGDQSRNIEQISTAIENIGSIMQTNAELADRSSNSCRHLSREVGTLNGVVADLSMVFGSSITSALRKKFLRKAEGHEAKRNCWEVKQCGRIPGGTKEREMGICPAYPNDGRNCWSVAGTFCGGNVQGSAAQKFLSCRECGFYQEASAGA